MPIVVRRYKMLRSKRLLYFVCPTNIHLRLYGINPNEVVEYLQFNGLTPNKIKKQLDKISEQVLDRTPSM